MNRARERRLLIERQIADAGAFQPAASTALAPEAQARLELYRQRYTQHHPDVLQLERRNAGALT